jgi:GDP-4-dehydro-6-deoxy-D-mannose reductase
MRALITGVNGFVGGHLAEHLLANDWEVVGVGRQTELSLADLRSRVSYRQADLEDRQAALDLLATVRPDAIFHLAGQAFVPQSFSDPQGTFATNIFAELNILLAMIEHKLDVPVLIAGSTEIYGHIRPEDLPVDEDTPLNPVSPYAVSKIAQDMLALQYHLSHQLKTIRARPFNHIGPRQSNRFAASSFAYQIAQIEAGKQEPILRVGNLSAQRDFTDVRDMAQAYRLAVLHATPGQAYNIGSGQAVSMQTILDTLLGHSSVAIEVQTDPARMRPADVPLVVCDASRFQAATGWKPIYTLSQTLADVLDEWRKSA